MPFSQQMTFPCELTLRTTPEGVRVFSEPVKEIENIHVRKHSWQAQTLHTGEDILPGIAGEILDIRSEFAVGDAIEFGFTIRSIPVIYNVDKQQLCCRGRAAPLKPLDGKIRLQLLVDLASIEISGNDGKIALPIGVTPVGEDRSLAVFCRGGGARINFLEVNELRSAWCEQESEMGTQNAESLRRPVRSVENVTNDALPTPHP